MWLTRSPYTPLVGQQMCMTALETSLAIATKASDVNSHNSAFVLGVVALHKVTCSKTFVARFANRKDQEK